MNEQRAARARSTAAFAGSSRSESYAGGFWRRIPALAGLVLVLSLGAQAQTALAPSDFAYGRSIEAVAGAPLQSVGLPPDVYRGVNEPGLRDLRVFNAAGQVVPHVVVSAVEFEPLEPRLEAVPVYSLMAEEEREELGDLPEAQPGTAGEGLDLESVLGLGETQRGPPAYLIDASGVAEEISGLRLYWDETDSFVSTIAVESSDDLLLWEPWGDPVAVAGLQAAEAVLTRNEVTLPARRASFIRLAHAEGAQLPLPPLTRAEVELVTEVDEGARQWWRPELSGSEGGAATFDLGAWVTVDSMRLVMPAGNVLAELTLQSAANPNRGWTTRTEGLFYRLGGEGAPRVRDTAGFLPTNDRYWRLELLGLAPEEILLELGQLPERLVFVARGEGPFTLAYGSAAAGDVDPQLSSLLDLGALRDGEVEVVAASLGEAFELGGESVRVGPGVVRISFAIFIAALLAVMMVTLIALRRRLERRRAEPEAQ